MIYFKRLPIYLGSLLFLISSCKEKPAEASYNVKSIDFGKKTHTDTIRGQFYIENIGEQDLQIQSVSAGCDCTIPEFSKTPIRTQEKGIIKFLYVPKVSDSGRVIKELIVKTNSIKRLEILTLTGTIL